MTDRKDEAPERIYLDGDLIMDDFPKVRGVWLDGKYANEPPLVYIRTDLAQSTIKAAEAAALRKAAEVAKTRKSDPFGPYEEGYVDGQNSSNWAILTLIDDQQSSALDAYVKAKVDEALERAANCASDKIDDVSIWGIEDQGDLDKLASDIAAAIRAMKE